ncbi:hypothetical protein [Halalkalibacter okhensis]|uniref:Peptidylprolyl isomerase n=1 Tax=Halalkalibacter okhensis TaxID=333138 RepID=A0A0B0IDP7_9BACI|nr:hypothetical protein [Halalkalibacter okhensis]KHF39385.1 hypothetical protein LQ50_15995 [Halalkalibacter okhensis]
MKKLFFFIFIVISILSAYHSSTLSFSQLETVPNNVQDKIDSNLKLQSITDGDKEYYIVFHSSGDVEADIETQGDTVTIKFNVSNNDGVVGQHLFYLTTGPEHDVLNVLVNGEITPFDNVTVQ